MNRSIFNKLILLFCGCLWSCFAGGDGDLFLQNASEDPQNSAAFGGNPGNSDFVAVIGQKLKIFRPDGQPFTEPLQVSLISESGLETLAAHFLNEENILTVKIAPEIPSGLTTLHVTDGQSKTWSGRFRIRRLGVIANRGNQKLLIFDTHETTWVQTLDIPAALGSPETLTISSDGRFCYVGLAQGPGTAGILTIDLTLNPPQIVSEFLELSSSPTTLVLLNQAPFILATNHGEAGLAHDTLELLQLTDDGNPEKIISRFSVSAVPAAGPFDIALPAPPLSLSAWITNRIIPGLAKVNLEGCVLQPHTDCAMVQTYTSSELAEPTGIVVLPDRQMILVADYQKNVIHEFHSDIDRFALVESHALDGGDQGPVALRLTAGGGRALVLNEESATLSFLDLTQGSPELVYSLPLAGEKPAHLALSFNSGDGHEAWISFSGSNEIRKVYLDLFVARVSASLSIPGLNLPRGIAIQP